MDEEKYAEALPLFNQAIAKDSTISIYRYNRAVALTNLNGGFNEATKDYKFLVAQLPDEASINFS